MRKQLMGLALFFGAGISSFLANWALFRAVLAWRGPFEFSEQATSPPAVLIGEAFVGGAVLGIALTAAGWAASKINLLTTDRIRRYSLSLNLVLFAFALPMGCLALEVLAHALHPHEVPSAVRSAVLGTVSFVLIPLPKLLVVRRALVGFANVSLVRALFAILIYWGLLLGTFYLAHNLIAEMGWLEMGWVERIAAAEGLPLAVILWIWLFTQGTNRVVTTEHG